VNVPGDYRDDDGDRWFFCEICGDDFHFSQQETVVTDAGNELVVCEDCELDYDDLGEVDGDLRDGLSRHRTSLESLGGHTVN